MRRLLTSRLPRFSRRTLALTTTAFVLSLAAAVPAFGLSGTIVDWFGASTAPSASQDVFAQMDVGAPKGMAPNTSGPARSILQASLNGTKSNLWVAPTQQSGFCTYLEGYAAGCDRDRSGPLEWASKGAVVFGDALSPEVDHIELRYANGDRVSIPVTRVSKPIDASFFVYEIPSTEMQPTGSTITIEAVTADGSTVATDTIPVFTPPTP